MTNRTAARARLALTAASCALAPLFAPAAALAQEDSQASGLQDIIVTAQKRSENLQDVPIAVAAISGESLAATGIQSVVSLPQATPNLSFSGNADNVNAYIRGIGTQYATTGLEPTVAVYLDDQYVVRPSASLLAFSDIERIEVLKGPQGTLYGRNATGGAIRIITPDPDQTPRFGASALYGSYDRVALSALANVPLSPTLSARVAADFERRDGYVKNDLPTVGSATHPDLQDRHQVTVHGKLLWQPGERFSLKLSADYSDKRDHEGQAFLPRPNSGPQQIGIALGGRPAAGFYHAVMSTPPDNSLGSKFFLRSGGASLRASYEFDGFTLSSITGYRKIRFDGPADADTTELVLLDVDSKQATESWSQELQAVSAGSGPLQWTAGLYGYTEKSRYKYYAWGAFSGMPAGSYIAGDGSVRTRSFAPYGQATFALADTFEVTVGARYTIEEKKLLGNLLTAGALDARGLPSDGPEATLASFGRDKVSFEEFTPKLVLSWKPQPGALVYLSYSKGFKSGGFNLPSFGAVETVRPESLEAYELGWKTQFGRVRFNGSAFYYDQSDLQVQYVNAAGAIGVQNAATARVYGVETDVTWAASDALTLRAGGGWLHARFRDYIGTRYVPASSTPACAAAPGSLACLGNQAVAADLGGNTLPLAPSASGYAGLNYRTGPLAGGEVTLDLLASYTARAYWDAANSVRERARVLVNGSLTWRSDDERLAVSVIGTNLTGRKYTVFQNEFTTGGWYIPAAPREVAIKLSTRF